MHEASRKTGLCTAQQRTNQNSQNSTNKRSGGKNIDQQEEQNRGKLKGKMKYIISKAVAVALLTMGLVASSFAGPTIYWLNDGNYSAVPDPLYLGSNTPVALSAGVKGTAGDGDLIQLVALWGGTNFVLASATVGDDPSAISPGPGGVAGPYNGYFEVQSLVDTNLLAVVYGDHVTPLGVVFYAGTTTASPYAEVVNRTIHVPSPTSQGTVYFDMNYSDLNFVGPRTAAGSPKGWFIDTIPEPSTMMLVGLGLLGAAGMRRRHRS